MSNVAKFPAPPPCVEHGFNDLFAAFLGIVPNNASGVERKIFNTSSSNSRYNHTWVFVSVVPSLRYGWFHVLHAHTVADNDIIRFPTRVHIHEVLHSNAIHGERLLREKTLVRTHAGARLARDLNTVLVRNAQHMHTQKC